MKTTLKELEALKEFLENLTNKKLKIDKSHLGYSLWIYHNEMGGITYLINGRHTKNELYNLIQAFIKGLTFSKN